MKPNWVELIEAHAEPVTRPGVRGKVFVLKRGVVAMTIRTRTATGPQSPRRRGTPFMFHRAPTPKGINRIEIDLSYDDFLIFRKNDIYTVAGKLQLVVHKQCIPWENISAIEFIESAHIVK